MHRYYNKFISYSFLPAGLVVTAPRFSHVLLKVGQFLFTVIGMLGIISIVIAGVLYLISAGDQSKAEESKKALKYAIIGLAMALSSLIIVRTITSILQG